MSRALEILDVNDLTTPDGARRFVINRDVKELRNFAEGFRQAMLDDQRRGSKRATLDDANYLPSSSLRGDSGCAAPECRLQKVSVMARYIALYCDNAIVPVRLPPFTEKANHRAEFFERFRLLGIILSLIELRPLIDAGLATLIPGELRLCTEHWKEGVPEGGRILDAAKVLATENADRFTITYHPPDDPGRSASFHYQGPDEFLEHGEIRYVLDTIPSG